MSKFKVGDTVVEDISMIVNGVKYPQLDQPAIVTEITDRGFAYRYITPKCLGTRIGVCHAGETFVPERWQLAEQQEMNYEQ